VLKNGGTIIYPTDTIWGIGCHPFHQNAIDQIFQLKQRPKEKNFILLVADIDMLKHYTTFLSNATLQFLKNCKKPTTAIYKNVRHLPDYLLAKDGSVAIRIIKHPYVTPLIKLLGLPLISTSANISGMDAPKNFSEIPHSILEEVNAILPKEMDVSTETQPSSIVEIMEDGAVNWIRK
jgi:L-threonylcarbamoyladenylate synthase